MKRNDWILIGAGLLIAAVIFGWTKWVQKDTGGLAVVYVDTEEYASYDLSEDGEYSIETERGTNVLVIKDGEANMTEADCPDKLCVQQKAISKNGETIVCLPHKVVVEIKNGEESQIDGQTK
ncbi:MAG: NusG domain II-containing protein [Lachnospiraceae bacterium]|nr:NusG domain II-containing protein [Lachnospiraceae bacterium]